MKLRKSVPTDQELEILKVIWQRGSATVREVFEDLLKQRQIAYTTVLTMMGILEQKGHVTKTPGERAYVYSSTHSEQQVLSSMVREFMDRVFDGSAERLVARLIENPEVTPAELDRIRPLLAGR